MIIILGLVILVAAVIAGVAGILGNASSGHALAHPFAVLGYHVAGAAGTLFLYGIVTGALGLLGLSLLLAGVRRTSRRGSAARGVLRQSRRETATVSQERDDLLSQREAARAYTLHDEQQNYTASTQGNGRPAAAAIPAQMPPAASAASGACSGPGPPLRRPPPRPHKR